MGKVNLLDCTLRDGGYVNDWMFGEQNIKGFCSKIARTGIEFLEVGFLKETDFNPDRAIFPTVESYIPYINPKGSDMKYVGMLDMSAPVSLDSIPKCDGTSIDGIRVIFKKNKIEEAYEYCKHIQELGYFISVNFVNTDEYTDEEFIHGIKKFNDLNPFAMSIVDTFGAIKRKQFLRMVYIADNNMAEGITLAYHAHNNLQQAFGNAEALVELNLKRDVLVDACVFGMGRGAGNLNLELFAEYMNENYDTDYKIEPMLEIMDEYLADIYRDKFWGYSLPLYISATIKCHPNYAIYLAEKDSLSASDFMEILSSIPEENRAIFSKEKAEEIYDRFLCRNYDDSKSVEKLKVAIANKQIMLIAPGHTLKECDDRLQQYYNDKEIIKIAINFCPEDIDVDYVFSNNMKRYRKMQDNCKVPCILTSNLSMDDSENCIVDYCKYMSDDRDIADNSGIMLLNLLKALGIKNVMLAGFDGYSEYYGKDYYDKTLEYAFSDKAEMRNKKISDELSKLSKDIRIEFVTPTYYTL